MSSLLALCVAADRGAAARPARLAASVVLLGLHFEGEVPLPVRKLMAEKLAAGLAAAGVKLANQAAVQKAIGDRGACHEASCWKSVAAALGCRAVGGKVRGEERSYEIELFIGDAYTGSAPRRPPVPCVLCGLVEAGNKVDLLASSLVAQLEATATAPARLTVYTDPLGATIFVDGDPVGPAPRELELPAGRHEIAAEAKGYVRTTRTVTAVAAVHERLELRMLAVPPTGLRRAFGWTGVAAGIASLGAGIVLLAIHGREMDCTDPTAGRVCSTRNTLAAGATLTAVGGLSIVGGGYLLYRDRAERRRVSLGAHGLGVQLAGQF